MKYSKNVYRNRLTDSHLGDLLRVACSNYKPDIGMQNSEKNDLNIKIHTDLKY
jgi:hypothetical protein